MQFVKHYIGDPQSVVAEINAVLETGNKLVSLTPVVLGAHPSQGLEYFVVFDDTHHFVPKKEGHLHPVEDSKVETAKSVEKSK